MAPNMKLGTHRHEGNLKMPAFSSFGKESRFFFLWHQSPNRT